MPAFSTQILDYNILSTELSRYFSFFFFLALKIRWSSKIFSKSLQFAPFLFSFCSFVCIPYYPKPLSFNFSPLYPSVPAFQKKPLFF